ncbi:DUF2156 domain-containing protein [Rubellimicrobium aerolatum]|uniref:Phosphatidylglycerol lysyltransferase domain-containing protein n=1 Tax=Rubellimicrobium aerolatum TaxID=490979 RepID=A0ABW0SBQ8_9RHOB|nr:DUF2156 domain-containing protein [Rubellimicrobium aerolatum]MBP1805592.1 phosphatidylglycerol lysyltransferase [Rubellimicrobium aerolatum]
MSLTECPAVSLPPLSLPSLSRPVLSRPPGSRPAAALAVPLRPRLRPLALARLALPAVVLAACLWLGAGALADLRLADLGDSLRGLTAAQWIGGLAATALAFVAVAGQERAILAHLGLRPDPARARGAALAAAAVSQTVGFGPVVGAIVRRRLLPGITAAQSFAISAAITLAFFAGLGLLLLAATAWTPGPWQGEARAALAALLLVAGAGGRALWARLGMRGITVLRLGLWVAVDCLALALAFWVLLPDGARPDYLALLPVFLLALGLGLASGSPAGAGPFEATLALHLPGLAPHDLLASLLAFRGVAHALPALCGAAWALLGPALLAAAPRAGLRLDGAPADSRLRALPRAEAQLARGGRLEVATGRSGEVWVGQGLALARAFLGDPQRPGGRAEDPMRLILAAQDLARREGRRPCLYKVGPRMATAARALGWAVLPIAREAVLDPRRFDLDGPAHARLRRKLRHAEKAGLRASMAPALLPLDEMEAVSDAWTRRHGGERGFSMGRWSRAHVAGQRVVLARDAAGRLVAFASFHAGPGEWALDLLRSAGDLPDGTMHLLIRAAIAAAAAEEVPRLSLAAVPEEGFGLRGPLAPWARRLSASGEGLRQFKSAFRPRWERRYIAAPGSLALVLGAAEIALAIHRPPPGR